MEFESPLSILGMNDLNEKVEVLKQASGMTIEQLKDRQEILVQRVFKTKQIPGLIICIIRGNVMFVAGGAIDSPMELQFLTDMFQLFFKTIKPEGVIWAYEAFAHKTAPCPVIKINHPAMEEVATDFIAVNAIHGCGWENHILMTVKEQEGERVIGVPEILNVAGDPLGRKLLDMHAGEHLQ